MVRVCKPDHTVGLIDLLSPSDMSLVTSYNRLERLRDPSHTLALTEDQLVNAMGASELSIQRVDTRDIPVDFERWVKMTGTEEQRSMTVRNELEQELNGGGQTGMRPYMQDRKLKFTQTWCVAIGIVSSNNRIQETSG